jgi:hypothetical protein
LEKDRGKSKKVMVMAQVVKEIHIAQNGETKGLGNYIVIEDPALGKYSIYAHLTSIGFGCGGPVEQPQALQVGQQVTQAD